jgi:hypothetical protein
MPNDAELKNSFQNDTGRLSLDKITFFKMTLDRMLMWKIRHCRMTFGRLILQWYHFAE